MDIQKYIDICYPIAVEKGFYGPETKIEDHLMGIVSEIGEAYEAHRNGKFADIKKIEMILNEDNFLRDEKDLIRHYEAHISGTFEDEISDIFIRLFNLSAHERFSIKLKTGDFYNIGWTNFSGDLLMIQDQMIYQRDYSLGLSLLYGFCNFHKIDIEKYIQAKIEYNKTRPMLHGKEY